MKGMKQRKVELEMNITTNCLMNVHLEQICQGSGQGQLSCNFNPEVYFYMSLPPINLHIEVR